MTDPQEFSSLDDALAGTTIPMENLPWIREITRRIDISSFVRTSVYVKAIRAGGGPDLRIAYGWTGGFTSPDEARDALGDLGPEALDVWPSKRKGLWGITHPVSRGYDGRDAGTRTVERERGVCPECFMQLPETGVCDTCAE